VRELEPLRYQETAAQPRTQGDELLYVQVRYKAPDDEQSKLLSLPVVDAGAAAPSADFRFQAAVAVFGLLLRNSPHTGGADWSRVAEAARDALGEDREGYRAEFVHLVESARGIKPPESARG
jgi:Ca-activated chloride channel family protein